MNKFDPNIFSINKNFSAKITEIGKSKSRLLEVENFFQHPELIRKFIENIPIQDATIKKEYAVTFFPGYQSFFRWEIPSLNAFFREACHDAFGFKLLKGDMRYSCQYIDGNKPIYAQSNLPHADITFFASNIFLNTEDEIGEGSGTAFYRSKHSGNELRPDTRSQYRINRDYGGKPPNLNMTRISTIIHNDDWERYHLSEQKWNKLNLYEGALYHSAFVKFNTFTKVPRISLTVADLSENY